MNTLEAYKILWQAFSDAITEARMEPTVYASFNRDACEAHKWECFDRREQTMKSFDEAMRLLESSGEDIPAHWITASPFTTPTITKTECGDFQLSMEPMDATENLEAIRREIQVRVFKLVNKPKRTPTKTKVKPGPKNGKHEIRNARIVARIDGGERPADVARDENLAPSTVSEIYKDAKKKKP